MSRRANACSHAPGKTAGKALAGKASRSRRELASPDDISNTMSLLACTDATHTASCRSAGVSRDPRGKDAAAVGQRPQAQLPVIEDSTCMSPYYGVPPPEPVRPDNSHTGGLPDNADSPGSSQGLHGREAADEAEPQQQVSPRPPVAAAAAVAPASTLPPRQEVCTPPRQALPADVAHPPEPAAEQQPSSWRPEPPMRAPARLHHPARAQGARARVEPPPADFLAAPQPVDKVLLDRFLTAAADTPGLPEDAHERSTISSSGSAALPAATLSRAASPGKAAARNPSAAATAYFTPRRGGTRMGDGSASGGRPQQHAQSAISALYRFATLAAERRAGGHAASPVVTPLPPAARRTPGLPRHSLSGELKPLLQEDSQLSPRLQASIATPREEPSPGRRARSASRNRRAWGCGPRASLACICGMPDVDEGSSFDTMPLVPTDAELSTRGAPRQPIRPQEHQQHGSPLLPNDRSSHNPAFAMYQGSSAAAHAHRSPLHSASVGTGTPRQHAHTRHGTRSALQGPHVIGAVNGSTRNSPRTPATSDLSHMPSSHWRDTNRQELTGALKQGSPLQYSEGAARGPCHRCGMSRCRCSVRRARHAGAAGECTPRADYGSPRLPHSGYASQPVRTPRPASSYGAMQRSGSQPVNGDLLHGIASRTSRSSLPPRMLGALGEYRGTRTAPVRPGPFGGPTESQPFRTMQQAMAAQVPPTAAVATQRIQGGFRPTPQRLEATSSWALSAALAAQSETTAAAAFAGSELGSSAERKAEGAQAPPEPSTDAAPQDAAAAVPEVEMPEAIATAAGDECMHAAAVRGEAGGDSGEPEPAAGGAGVKAEALQDAAAAGRPTSQTLVAA